MMAAKQQGKKKARDVKRKKLQKKHQLAKRKQKKMQPQKLKKHQARSKRQAKQSSASKSEEPERICSPKRFANKVLRQMPKVRMEAKARALMKTLLADVYDHVATEMQTLSQKNKLSNISGSDVQTAPKEAMTKELAKHSGEPPSTECAQQNVPLISSRVQEGEVQRS